MNVGDRVAYTPNPKYSFDIKPCTAVIIEKDSGALGGYYIAKDTFPMVNNREYHNRFYADADELTLIGGEE